MSDRGWVLNRDRARWELRGADGERVHAWVTLEMAARTDPVMLNRALAGRGLPTLAPDLGWWECALVGGPWDGRYEYLDPAAWDRPPPVLYLNQDATVVVLADRAIGRVPLAAYQRGPQRCGHGRACPYPYFWREATGG